MSSEEIKCGVYPVWRRMSANGSVPVSDLTGTERRWAALLVRHRLAAVRSRRLVQLDRAAVMSNWTALESGQAVLRRTALRATPVAPPTTSVAAPRHGRVGSPLPWRLALQAEWVPCPPTSVRWGAGGSTSTRARPCPR